MDRERTEMAKKAKAKRHRRHKVTAAKARGSKQAHSSQGPTGIAEKIMDLGEGAVEKMKEVGQGAAELVKTAVTKITGDGRKTTRRPRTAKAT
jgi:hypothetical protein